MGLPASTYTSLSSHCSWSGLCKTSVRTMIRKLINIFSLPLNKIQTWTIGCYDLAPALHYLWSSILFSLELFVSTTAGCMLFLKQMKPLFLCVRTNTSSLLQLEHCPWTSHCLSVKSPFRCLLLREAFLSSNPLSYFIFLMDLLLYFPCGYLKLQYFVVILLPQQNESFTRIWALFCPVHFIVPRTWMSTWNWLNKQIHLGFDYW